VAASPTPTPEQVPLPASNLDAAEAIPLADNSISLKWEPVAKATHYRIYSDMGTGYGVYIFKAETDRPELTDTALRAGLRYDYRIQTATPAGETAIAWAKVETPADTHAQEETLALSSGSGVSAAAIAKPRPSPVRVTPAPTPLPPDTVILGLLSANDYGDDVEDSLAIVGEVRNDSHLDVGETSVTATFYDTEGQVIGEASGPTMLPTLAPGARSPFMINLPRPAGLANYSLRATGRPVNLTGGDRELTVVTTRRFEDTAGFYHVAGVIENPSQQRIEQARVIVTLYDRGGRVINVGFAYPQPPSLSPNDRADFDVTFTYYPKVFSHLAIAAGD
jgi:hypothetical protein